MELDSLTRITNDLGRVLVLEYEQENINPYIDGISAKIENLDVTERSYTFESLVDRFFDISYKIDSLHSSPPIFNQLEFKPHKSGYDQVPYKVRQFRTIDWLKSREEFKRYKIVLMRINNELDKASVFSPSDPFPILPIAIQLTVPIAILPTFFLTYGFDLSRNVMISFIVISMLLSILLVTFNSNTLLNIAFQSIVPAVFGIAWFIREKRKQHRPEVSISNQESPPVE